MVVEQLIGTTDQTVVPILVYFGSTPTIDIEPVYRHLTKAVLLYWNKFIVFKAKPVTGINPEWQQSNGYFGGNASVIILDNGIITSNIDYSAKHYCLL